MYCMSCYNFIYRNSVCNTEPLSNTAGNGNAPSLTMTGNNEPQGHHDRRHPQLPPPVPTVHPVQCRYAPLSSPAVSGKDLGTVLNK